ncbi:phosphatidate cytidylyltransferase [Candidatus Acetothermia bacterium]|nr:phosphatidate cytidylyltransferase [Candidatus Acetothermia bacterium]
MMNLIERLATSVILIPTILGLLYIAARYGLPWIIGIILMVVAIPAGLEYIKLMHKTDIKIARWEFVASIPFIIFAYIVFDGRYGDIALLIGISYQILRYLRGGKHRQGLAAIAAGAFGLLYIPWMLHFFYRIFASGPTGWIYASSVFLMVCAYDAGAYAVGSRFGRHRVFPLVSPNKTWEGLLGGFILTVIITALSLLWIGELTVGQKVLHILLLSGLISAATQIGDLFESKLKRAAGVKDSGIFLPGHGGALDRLDGFLFALPAFYFYFYEVLGFIY